MHSKASPGHDRAMRKLLKVVTWLLTGVASVVVLAIVALFAINATDVPLSAEAEALLRTPPPPEPTERNGFIDYLALGAAPNAPTFTTGAAQLAILNKQADGALLDVTIDTRVRACRSSDVFACVAKNPALKEVIASHGAFLARYRAMRKQPEFIDLEVRASPEEGLHAYLPLTGGQRLSLQQAAFDFSAARRTKALDEIEAEFRFHRTMAAGSRTLIAKMLAFAMLDIDRLFAAALARRLSAHDRGQWARLHALLGPLEPQVLDVRSVWTVQDAQTAAWMRTRKYVRISDHVRKSIREYGDHPTPTWFNTLSPWLYRPHYSVNRFVAQSAVVKAVADTPANGFFRAQREARVRLRDFDTVKALILSPGGTFNLYLADHDYSDYIGRMHAQTAMQSLVALQVRLRASGIIKPADVERALSGSLGREYPNPFTGEPMTFNAVKMTLGFASDLKLLPGPTRDLFVDGRVELPL